MAVMKPTSQPASVITDPDALTPYPSLIPRPNDAPSRRQWTFKDGNKPRTDLTNKVMIIPSDDSDDSYSARQHEMLHVAFSPQIEGLRPSLLAVEDARIHILAAKNGIEVEASDKIPSETGVLHALMGDKDSALQFAVASIGTPAESEVLNLLDAVGETEITDLARYIKEQLELDPSFENGFILSDLIQSTLDNMSCLGGIDGDPDEMRNDSGSPGGDSVSSEAGDESSESDGEGECNSDGSPEPSENDSGSPGSSSVTGGEDKDKESSEGSNSDSGGSEKKTEKQPAKKRAASAHMTSDELKKHVDDAIKSASASEEVRKVVKVIQKKMQDAKPKPKPASTSRPESDRKTSIVAEATPNADGTTKDGERPKDVLPVEIEYLYNNPYQIAEGSGKRWGRMDIRYPALVVPCLGKGKGPKATDFGVVPVRLHRTIVDQKVFTQPRGKRRGTILCDMSGSMSLTDHQILELLDKAPAAVIAGYYGDRSTGTLVILAANGFRAEDIRARGYNNMVDGPAVEWLARQKVPRIYVTDEGFTGIDGSINKQDIAGHVLYTTVERARITIVPTIEEAIRAL